MIPHTDKRCKVQVHVRIVRSSNWIATLQSSKAALLLDKR